MSETWEKIVNLVQRGEIVVSEHGYEEIAADDIRVRNIVSGVANGEVIEDYPEYRKGPCVLVLQSDTGGRPIHAVWGIPRGSSSPAVLITGYRPDPERWTDDFRRRKT
jgi:hypothetical protein